MHLDGEVTVRSVNISATKKIKRNSSKDQSFLLRKLGWASAEIGLKIEDLVVRKRVTVSGC